MNANSEVFEVEEYKREKIEGCKNETRKNLAEIGRKTRT